MEVCGGNRQAIRRRRNFRRGRFSAPAISRSIRRRPMRSRRRDVPTGPPRLVGRDRRPTGRPHNQPPDPASSLAEGKTTDLPKTWTFQAESPGRAGGPRATGKAPAANVANASILAPSLHFPPAAGSGGKVSGQGGGKLGENRHAPARTGGNTPFLSRNVCRSILDSLRSAFAGSPSLQ